MKNIALSAHYLLCLRHILGNLVNLNIRIEIDAEVYNQNYSTN